MNVNVMLRMRDIAPFLRRRLYEVMDTARWFLEIDEERTVHDILHYSSILSSMLEGDEGIIDVTAEEGTYDWLLSMLERSRYNLDYVPTEKDLTEERQKDEPLPDTGHPFRMESWILEKAGRLWKTAGEMVETLWVGGDLYEYEIDRRATEILKASGDVAHILGVMETFKPSYGLDYSSYFKAKYGDYYSVYQNAGYGNTFAIQGQKRLDKLAREIHKREKFFSDMFRKYDQMDIDSVSSIEIGDLLHDFPGVDRRVEIIRQLSREAEMTYGTFSAFDPRRTMAFLMEEIRNDCYGGAYVPPGEDEASYECVVTQLRSRWFEKHSIS